MASIVVSQLGPSGLPKESGYTAGFAAMAGGLVLAALAGLLIPSAQRLRPAAAEPDQGEIARVAGATAAADSGPLDPRGQQPGPFRQAAT
jgi:hypothetical protein